MSAKSKYKVGDKVTIKGRDWYEKHKNDAGTVYMESTHFTNTFVGLMAKYCGKEAVITHVDDDLEDEYRIDIDNGDFLWSCYMFEEPIQEESIKDLFKSLSELNIWEDLEEYTQRRIQMLYQEGNDREKLVLEKLFGTERVCLVNTWRDFERLNPIYEWNPEGAYKNKLDVLKKIQLLIDKFFGGIPDGSSPVISRITRTGAIIEVMTNDDNYVPGILDFNWPSEAARFIKYNRDLVDMFYN